MSLWELFKTVHVPSPLFADVPEIGAPIVASVCKLCLWNYRMRWIEIGAGSVYYIFISVKRRIYVLQTSNLLGPQEQRVISAVKYPCYFA
jgi:hypothetical protein